MLGCRSTECCLAPSHRISTSLACAVLLALGACARSTPPTVAAEAPSLAPNPELTDVASADAAGAEETGTEETDAEETGPNPLDTPSTVAARADLVYLIMVDRFYNGDHDNDATVDRGDPHAFHGGDIQGVIEKVDYLADLGVTTVWLTPVFAMRTEKIGEWGAFHGYWVRDLSQIEARFGDETTLYKLSTALHDRGMRLVLDMVWNHTDYDAPLLVEHPDWYHDTGDIVAWDDPVEVVTGRVHGLPDLAQENPAVADYLRTTSESWLERAGVDGFRVDAVRHMPLDFLSDINASLHQRQPGLWTVGEDFNGDATALARTLQQGGFDAVFDFPLRYAMIDVFCQDAPMQRIASVLSADRLIDDPSRLVTFLDNHDLPRVLTECNNEAWRADSALTFLMNVRGTPSLTWGTELALAGGEEPDNRADMPWGRTGDLFLHRRQGIRQAMRLRDETPASRTGRSRVLQANPDQLVVAQVLPTEAVIIRAWRGAPTSAPGLPSWARAEGVSSGPGTRQSGGPTGSTEGVGLHVDVLRLAWEGDGPAPWATLVEPPSARPVTLTLKDAPAGELRVVGAPSELGGWNPAAAPTMTRDDAGLAHAEIDLPEGMVADFKIVSIDAVGAVTWESRANRFLHVGQGQDLTGVELSWGR
jgi:glycosidase